MAFDGVLTPETASFDRQADLVRLVLSITEFG